MGPSPHLWFLHAKLRLWIRIAGLYWSQTSPVDLWMQHSLHRSRNASLYGSQPSSVVMGIHKETLWPELIVSMGHRPHLSFCECKTAWFATESLVSMGPRPHLSFCASKTTWSASELLVSMCPSRHLWFLHAEERLLDQNYKSLWVPDLTYDFLHAKQRD